jgi:hypothetical protein
MKQTLTKSVRVDIFHSLLNLTKPIFPCSPSTETLVKSLQETWDDKAEARFAAYKDGFWFLDTFPDGPRLRETLHRTRICLESYAAFLRSPRTGPDILTMEYTRRALRADALQVPAGGNCLFEAARLSTIIFLAEVGGPLPLVGEFHEKISQLLLAALDKCAISQYWQTYPEFFLWATVLGGLAARENPRVLSFAKKLQNSSVALNKDSWVYVKEVSLKFLPFEYAWGDLCHAFWDEACELLTGRESQWSV